MKESGGEEQCDDEEEEEEDNLKISILWDITPCSPVKINRRFGRTYHFHRQVR
jgi:hypothetical protein